MRQRTRAAQRTTSRIGPTSTMTKLNQLALLTLTLATSALAQPGIPGSISTTKGIRESGNLLSTTLPDGNRYVVRATGNSFKNAEIVYTASNPAWMFSGIKRINLYLKMDFSVRRNLSADVFNWQANRWETKLILYDIIALDIGNQIAVGREFFGPNGTVRVRMRASFSNDFRMRFDWLVLTAGF